jgi:hypothetical protein
MAWLFSSWSGPTQARPSPLRLVLPIAGHSRHSPDLLMPPVIPVAVRSFQRLAVPVMVRSTNDRLFPPRSGLTNGRPLPSWSGLPMTGYFRPVPVLPTADHFRHGLVHQRPTIPVAIRSRQRPAISVTGRYRD